MKLFSTSAALVLIAILTSCSKDENPPDFVGESVGSYTATVRILRAGSTSANVITSELTVSRNGDDLTIIADGIETFKSSRVELASKGYGFDLEAATVVDDEGDLVDRKGIISASINGKSYHGRFDADAKKLYINASYTYQDTKYAPFNFSAEVTATKK